MWAMNNRRLIIAAVAFVIVGAVVLALLQYVLKVQGAVLKLIIGIVIAAIAAAIAYMVVKNPAQPAQ
jgi:riboflavin transporter FmnP